MSTAHADVAGDARAHFETANAHYAIGEFSEAATEYETAYKLKPDAALLFDAGQAHRLAGNHQKALTIYRNFLRMYPDNPNAPEVMKQVKREEEAIAADDKAKKAPPTGTVAPAATPAIAASPTTPAQATTTPSSMPAGKVATTRETARPVYKKWWLWTAVGVAVAAAVVIPIAVVETRPAWTDATVGPGSTHGLDVRF